MQCFAAVAVFFVGLYVSSITGYASSTSDAGDCQSRPFAVPTVHPTWFRASPTALAPSTGEVLTLEPSVEPTPQLPEILPISTLRPTVEPSLSMEWTYSYSDHGSFTVQSGEPTGVPTCFSHPTGNPAYFNPPTAYLTTVPTHYPTLLPTTSSPPTDFPTCSAAYSIKDSIVPTAMPTSVPIMLCPTLFSTQMPTELQVSVTLTGSPTPAPTVSCPVSTPSPSLPLPTSVDSFSFTFSVPARSGAHALDPAEPFAAHTVSDDIQHPARATSDNTTQKFLRIAQ
jgi:hypothetical protein